RRRRGSRARAGATPRPRRGSPPASSAGWRGTRARAALVPRLDGNMGGGRRRVMAKVLVLSTNGSENPTKASRAVLLAKAAVEEGHEVKIALVGDAAVNIRDTVAAAIQGVGLPAYKELMEFLVTRQVNFFV